ncbi:MAG: ergothioneine biosynthesis protein EgtB [Actinomycetota bacterium]|nr:ergothioneine biosynthesis protein EgtB [Actinomycetota bacterium]
MATPSRRSQSIATHERMICGTGGPVPTGSGYQAVRDATEGLAAPLSPEDQTVQTMADVSPTKWHRAHTTWFWEQFVLLAHAAGYEAYDERYLYLFNSYYEGAGPRHPRNDRGLLTRPGAGEVTAYRQIVDEAIGALLGDGTPEHLADVVELGLHHEQQHQELLLMDIKHVLGTNPLRPTYLPELRAPRPSDASPLSWVGHEGGLVEIGTDLGDHFAFDDESPRHRVWLDPYELGDRLITEGEWLEFIDAGGYQQADLWLSDGWGIVCSEERVAPLYWERDGDDWDVYSLGGWRRLDPAAPVVHISYHEADAFARWRGCRLPTEAEWEAAAASVSGPLVAPIALHPTAAAGQGLRQLYDSAWQWTSSAFSPYPGFEPAPGVVGEYNGKFMVAQQALRGGASITAAGHTRSTYRNFFPPAAQWAFSGLRLARSAT